MKCHNCKANDHLIKQYPKLKAKEAHKKEANVAVAANASTNFYSANVAHRMQNGHLVRSVYLTHLLMRHVFLNLWTMFGTLTVVLPSTLPHIEICLHLLRLSLMEIL